MPGSDTIWIPTPPISRWLVMISLARQLYVKDRDGNECGAASQPMVASPTVSAAFGLSAKNNMFTPEKVVPAARVTVDRY